MRLYTIKSLPNSDVAPTEARLARGCERRVLRVSASFSCFDVGRGWLGNPRVFDRKDWDAMNIGREGEGWSCGNKGGNKVSEAKRAGR